MKKTVITVILINISFLILISIFVSRPKPKSDLKELKEKVLERHVPSVDHSKLAALQVEFETPQEVTMACISCHTERHKEVMNSSHWTWEREEYIEGRGVTYKGKKNLINNFCIGIGGSEQACTKCHVGYGWEDKSFDFVDEKNVDCLICHDGSEKYSKKSGAAGYPKDSLDLTAIAQSVGIPQRANCGICHFYGGGGNNVKHGDLEEAMFSCEKDVDVHMGIDGMDMSCVDCHTAENHKILGQMYSVSSMDKERVTCEQCHTETPHTDDLLNEHVVKVACQTCHIPKYAKVNPTKLTWDWSTAGKLKDGKPYHEEDEDGNHTYYSIKGTFTWGKNIEPEYIWFNGTADHYLIGDVVDTTEVIKVNTLNGEYKDENSKIIPVKIHRAKQIYDCKNKMLIQPKLFAKRKGEGAYWKDFDWDLAAKLGMEAVDASYSGSFCFVKTEMYWPINHMVSTKEKAVGCIECHTRDNSRLANLTDFYMPGRDYNAAVDFIGILVIILSLGGIIVHALIRIFINYKK